MTAKHGPSDENLLQFIAQKEKELEAKVAHSREESQRRVEEARRRAEEIRERSRLEAEKLAEEIRDEMEREAASVSKERLAKAQTEAARVRARAAERMPKAVELILQRVLAGLEQKSLPS
ncbi:MAG: hypothetical protein HYU43_00395 [Armatimonadetes bacterium]|nr:hypothetical protein [Armatimonadota bacterium]MBI2247195.1 hypothetical protein [Armatimonadota bacterium]